MKKNRILVSVDEPEKRKFKNQLPKILESYNHHRAIVKSLLKTEKLPKDYKATHKLFIDNLTAGMHHDITLTACANAKGMYNEYTKLASLYAICKENDEKYSDLIPCMILGKRGYEFSDEIENILNDKFGNYVEGDLAIQLYKYVDEWLTMYQKLDTISENRILKNYGAIAQSTPLIQFNSNLTLSVNHNTINELANSLENDTKMDDFTSKVLNSIYEEEEQKKEAAIVG